MKYLIPTILILGLVSCSIPGSANVPVSAQGAQTLTGQQGQAGDTAAATTHGSPVIVFNFASAKMNIKTKADGAVEMSAEGSDSATITLSGPLMGNIEYGDNAMQSDCTQGGGSAAGTSGTQTAPAPVPVVTSPSNQ